MGNDMRLVKFRMMIRDIYVDLGKTDLTRTLSDGSGNYLNGGYGAVWLAAIYDYDKLNDYGKAIIEQVSEMTEKDRCEDETSFSYKIKFVKNCQDMEYRMKAAEAIVTRLNRESQEFKLHVGRVFEDLLELHFMFWSLMILAVDDTDKEEHLSLICDFARMLKVSDFEMMDMVQIIRAICNIEWDDKIVTESVNTEFKEVIKRYGIVRADGIAVTDGDIEVALSGLGGVMSGLRRGV